MNPKLAETINSAFEEIKEMDLRQPSISDFKALASSSATGMFTIADKAIAFSTMGHSGIRALSDACSKAHEAGAGNVFKSETLCIIDTMPSSVTAFLNTPSVQQSLQLTNLEQHKASLDLAMSIKSATGSRIDATHSPKPERDFIHALVAASALTAAIENERKNALARELIEELLYAMEKLPQEFQEAFGLNPENVKKFLNENVSAESLEELAESITSILESIPDMDDVSWVSAAMDIADHCLLNYEISANPVLNDYKLIQANPAINPMDLSIGPMPVNESDKSRYKEKLSSYSPPTESLSDDFVQQDIINTVLGQAVFDAMQKQSQLLISVQFVIEKALEAINEKLHSELNTIQINDQVYEAKKDLEYCSPTPFDAPYR